MNLSTTLNINAELEALVIRGDGSHRNLGLLSNTVISSNDAYNKLIACESKLKQLWHKLRSSKVLPVALTFAAFLQALHSGDGTMMALVTTAGVNYMAADFLSASSARISAFNYLDCGSGTTSAVIGDTGLQTAAGTARVAGTQSNPSAGQYRTSGTVAFSSSLAITEFGLFSASTAGTMWDRRVFAAINVANGDSITFQYTLTVNAG